MKRGIILGRHKAALAYALATLHRVHIDDTPNGLTPKQRDEIDTRLEGDFAEVLEKDNAALGCAKAKGEDSHG